MVTAALTGSCDSELRLSTVELLLVQSAVFLCVQESVLWRARVGWREGMPGSNSVV